MTDFADPVHALAYLLGELGGGLFGIVLLTLGWAAALRPIRSPVGRTIVASVLSLATATVLGAYVFGSGRVTDFAFSFGRYTVPQLVVLAVMLGFSWGRSKAD